MEETCQSCPRAGLTWVLAPQLPTSQSRAPGHSQSLQAGSTAVPSTACLSSARKGLTVLLVAVGVVFL